MSKQKSAEHGEVKAYTAPEPVYQAGKLHAPGDPFVTADKPNENWTETELPTEAGE